MKNKIFFIQVILKKMTSGTSIFFKLGIHSVSSQAHTGIQEPRNQKNQKKK